MKKKIRDLTLEECDKICQNHFSCSKCPLGFRGGFILTCCCKDYDEDYVNAYNPELLNREVEIEDSKQPSVLDAWNDLFLLVCYFIKQDEFQGKIRYCSSMIGDALRKQQEDAFELKVFKLAYEWKCNGVEGTYEEVLEQAKRTVEGWNEINKKGYGTIIE